MFHRFAKALLAPLSLFCMSAALAAEAPSLSITPEPGKETCVSAPAGAHTLQPQLCVVGGMFSHDVYTLKLDGRVVLKGIDDQTTEGVEARYKDQALRLRCVPQNIFAKETPEATAKEIQAMLPQVSASEAARLAGLLLPGPMGMELARLCTATSNGATVLSAQVLFL